MAGTLLQLRWSWRDLRARWLQVAAIALVIGIGSGVYSGLSSTSEWRRASFDASYDRLAMWGLRVELTEGTTAPAGALVAAASATPGVAAVTPRLSVPIQVDASTEEEVILVPGRLIGIPVGPEEPEVSRVEARTGRGFEPADAGADTALLDEHFAAHYGLASEGRITVTGGHELRYVGRALAPEHLVIIPPQGTVFGEAGYAVVWTSLETAQRLGGRPGAANDLAVRVDAGADLAAVEAALGESLGVALGGLGFTTTRQQDDPVLRTLYDDIEADQRFNNVFAVLILFGAAFAAFNLTGRIVEAQRREIGIGMALGVEPARLALRPLLVGTQIAALGAAFGVGVGFAIQAALRSVLDDVLVLPIWITDFQAGTFARGAALGLVLPLAATLMPVIRALRVAPVDAIRTRHRTASGGLAPLLRRVPLPGSSVAHMPVRNVARAPRRALLTALGIGAAIATLVGVVGMIDSFVATLDRGREEILGQEPDRLTIEVELSPVGGDAVRDVLDAAALAGTEAGLTLGATVGSTEDEVDVFLSVVDLGSPLWRPTALEGSLSGDGSGLVLARKAADDLGVGVGDRVSLRHPRLTEAGFELVTSEVGVTAIHPNPFRFMAYMDTAAAGLFGLEGLANTVTAVPAPGFGVEDAQRALFGQPGVISVQPVRAQVDAIQDRIEEFVGIFTVVQAAVLVLALLIAFNAASINVDERRREHATMFAFGLPVRVVVTVAVVESVLIGIAGTAIGVVAGRLLVGWLTGALVADSFPDVGVEATVAGATVLTALALGVAAVAVAPLLTVRRLRRTDIPSALRVME